MGKHKKNGNGGNQTAQTADPSQTDGGETGENGDATAADTAAASGTTKKRRGGRGEYTKNFIVDPGFSGEGRRPSFPLTDADSIAGFVTAFGNMGEQWDGGYETHYNNEGPLTRKGVERMSNNGKGKTIAVFLDALASDAALAGSANDLPASRDPQTAEGLLVAMHEYLGTLIERKRAEIEDRNLEAAARVAGVPVEALRNLRKQHPVTA